MSFKNKKTLLIAGGILLAAAAISVIGIFSLRKEEAYRSILVYEMEGSAVIERASVGTLSAAENLYLESGDRVSVQPDSLMRLKLDDDKYITAEADTVFVLTAEGDEQNSKTQIQLVQGAITNEIQNPLSEGATYETITPNSVMAVRGTIYRAELAEDGQGGLTTRMSCFKGKVATRPADASDASEEVLVEAGAEVYVYADNTVSKTAPIDFQTLPAQALQVLSDLEVETDGLTQEPVSPQASQETPSPGESASVSEPAVQPDQTATPQKTEKPAVNSARPAASAAPTQTPSATPVVTHTPEPPKATAQTTEPPKATSQPAQTAEPQKNPPQPAPTAGPSADVTEYQVTFQYGESTFAIQSVREGEKVSPPLLRPAPKGKWNFDFNTPITESITIEWTSDESGE